jgi:hypothetical protein
MRRAMTAWRSARSASLFVGGRFGSATKAMTAPQSPKDFPGEIANLLVDVMPVALTVLFCAVRQPLERLRVGSVADALDEAAQVSRQFAPEASARALRMRWARQRWRRG